MTIRRMCDVCESANSEDIRDLPMGWTHIGIQRKDYSPTEPQQKPTTIDVIKIDVCGTCGSLISDRIKAVIEEVKEAAS